MLGEALLGLYGWIGLVAAIARGSLGFVLFFALFAAGFTLTAALGWQGSAHPRLRRPLASPRAGER